MRVLLVDDHAEMRRALVRCLRQEPVVEIVGEAPDGKLAVEMAGRLAPDLILMDVIMPGMDGMEATRAILQVQPHIRIIGLSAYEEDDQGQRMLDAGAVGYVSKTRLRQTLLPALRRIQCDTAA